MLCANCKAGAAVHNIPLYKHISNLAGNKKLELQNGERGAGSGKFQDLVFQEHHFRSYLLTGSLWRSIMVDFSPIWRIFMKPLVGIMRKMNAIKVDIAISCQSESLTMWIYSFVHWLKRAEAEVIWDE
ncbi:Uncharacterized protein Adt_38009 [Abeliophyllum distichum]|uniref:Uncharacterized protein n=1 Tax=Abeliophyllum distichum TaxID=126358 RepID=A0ABD1Q119_9LAMI